MQQTTTWTNDNEEHMMLLGPRLEFFTSKSNLIKCITDSVLVGMMLNKILWLMQVRMQ